MADLGRRNYAMSNTIPLPLLSKVASSFLQNNEIFLPKVFGFFISKLKMMSPRCPSIRPSEELSAFPPLRPVSFLRITNLNNTHYCYRVQV